METLHLTPCKPRSRSRCKTWSTAMARWSVYIAAIIVLYISRTATSVRRTIRTVGVTQHMGKAVKTSFYLTRYDSYEDFRVMQRCESARRVKDSEDVLLLNLFRKHPDRVYTPRRASIFVISFPLLASYWCKEGNHLERVERVFSSLEKSHWFQRNSGRDHLILTWTWRISMWNSELHTSIIPRRWQKLLENVTQTRYERYHINPWVNATRNNSRFTHFEPTSLLQATWEMTRSAIVVPYATSLPIAKHTTYEEWRRRKNFCFYYRANRTYAHMSTPLRQLPEKKSHYFSGCDIGWRKPHAEWQESWSQSQFCFAIRGDTPSSHSFYNAVASDCIPVVISDVFEVVAMPFEDMMPNLRTYALHFTEETWLHNTSYVLSTLRSLSATEVKELLSGLNKVKTLLLYKYPRNEIASAVLLSMMPKLYSNSA